MKYNDEREIFKEILSSTHQGLKANFDLEIDQKIYVFTEKRNPDNYVTVNTSSKVNVPVNSNFNFARPAGSNNYPELIDVANHLLIAFNLPHI